MAPIKVAIVKDWLTSYGGSEEQLIQALKVYPNADVYTSVYDSKRLPQLKEYKINSLSLPNFFQVGRNFELLIPFLPLYFSRLNLSQYDVVISITSGFSKGVKTGSTPHICICNTPIRFAWGLGGDKRGIISKLLSPYFRWYDLWSAKRVDYFYGNSENVAERIRKIYKTKSSVLYPPVRTKLFHRAIKNKKDYYITVSRLVPYKKIDLIVVAFSQTGKKLIVVGEGPMKNTIQKGAASNIIFRGFLQEEKIIKLLSEAKGFIFAANEDFGIAPVEAMAAGCPVVAYSQGGACETLNNNTGVFFDKQTKESLIKAVEQFERKNYQLADLHKQAEKFSAARFRKDLEKIVTKHI